jgi:hypothetical protein
MPFAGERGQRGGDPVEAGPETVIVVPASPSGRHGRT